MKKINYTGDSKIITRTVELLNEKAPLPESNNSTDWGTNGQVLATDGSGSTFWKTALDNTVDNLINYYLKSETYTQAEVNALISSITSINFEIVTVLPTTDISQSTIYLVPKTTAQTDNIYDEYINTDGTTAGWEHIGDTQVDLSNYIQKSQTNGLVKNDGTIDTSTYSTTDEKVKQDAVTSDKEYRLLLSTTDTDTTETNSVKKNSELTYNPSRARLTVVNLEAVKINGSLLGNNPVFTDSNVLQEEDTTHTANYRVLLGYNSNGQIIGQTYQNPNLTYNPSTNNLQVSKINGVTVGNSPKFTDMKVLYGICSTAASDPDKKVVLAGTTLTDAEYSSLPIGTFLSVKFVNTNSAINCTVSIVDDDTNPTKYTTPASIYYNASAYTNNSQIVCGYANRHNYYVWNGTEWVWVTRGVETEFSNMSTNELVTGTATNQRTVRSDYLNAAIRELINSYGWATQGATEISGTSSQHYDLNTLVTPGNYYVKNNANAAYIDNRPTGSTETAFNLIVIRNLEKTNYYRQIAWTYSGANLYIRGTTDTGSTWTSWTNLNKTVGTAALTLKQNGVTLDSFGANATSAKTINITTPLAGTLFGTCTTGASTAVKVITLDSSYSGTAALPVGTTVNVVFESSNTNSSPSIKIGDTTYTVKILSNTAPTKYNDTIQRLSGQSVYTIFESGGVAGYVCRYLIADSSTAIYLGRDIVQQAEVIQQDVAQPIGVITTADSNSTPFAGTIYKTAVLQRRANVNTDNEFNFSFFARLPDVYDGANYGVVYSAEVWYKDADNISYNSYKADITKVALIGTDTQLPTVWVYMKALNQGSKNLIYSGEIRFTLYQPTS